MENNILFSPCYWNNYEAEFFLMIQKVCSTYRNINVVIQMCQPFHPEFCPRNFTNSSVHFFKISTLTLASQVFSYILFISFYPNSSLRQALIFSIVDVSYSQSELSEEGGRVFNYPRQGHLALQGDSHYQPASSIYVTQKTGPENRIEQVPSGSTIFPFYRWQQENEAQTISMTLPCSHIWQEKARSQIKLPNSKSSFLPTGLLKDTRGTVVNLHKPL